MSVLSLTFIELLSNLSQGSNHFWQLNVINEIITTIGAEEGSNVQTIAFFGDQRSIDSYITASEGTPKIIITDSFSEINFNDGTAYNRNIFFLAAAEKLEQSNQWQYLNRAFTNMQGLVRGIFIFQRSTQSLWDHFAWCWRRGFAHVLVLIELHDGAWRFDNYSYTRFPELRVVQLQLSPGAGTYFPNKLKNLMGYRLRSPAQYDPPRVFEVLERKSNTTLLKGYAAEMFQLFLRAHNAGLEIVQLHNSSDHNILGVIEQIKTDEIDLSMNPFSPYKGVRLSYPIRMMQWCILVPYSAEIDAFEYFLRPFTMATWQSCVVGWLYLSFMQALSGLWLVDELRSREINFGRALTEVLRLLLFLPIPTSKLGRRFRWHYALCYMQTATLGFILSNLYLASLTSFRAKLIFDQQLDTLVAMVQRNLSIYANDYEIPIILENRGLPRGFAELLVPRHNRQHLRDVISLTSRHNVGYMARVDMINFALVQQNHLLRPLFHPAAECLTTVPIGFLLPTHTQLESTLNEFIFRAASSGLTDKCIQSTASDGFRAGILRIQTDEQTATRPLSVEQLEFAWIMLACGTALALLCFALESTRLLTRRLKLFVIYY